MEKKIHFLKIFYLKGPNLWSYRPMLESWIDIQGFEEYPSNTLSGFNERLQAYLPGLINHKCSYGEKGGFLKRLEEGTWIGHILEHVALEVQALAGMPVSYGRTRSTREKGVYKLAFRSDHEALGRQALHTGRDLIMACVKDTPFDLSAAIDGLKELIDDVCLGPSTAHIVNSARTSGIPAIRLSENNLVQLGYGKKQRRIWTAVSDQTSAIATDIASDKDLTKRILKAAGIPVPNGQMVNDVESAWAAAQDIGFPVVVKPDDSNHGTAVFLNLTEKKDIELAFNQAITQTDEGVIVEQFIQGNEYRILVVNGAVVAALSGTAVSVRGNGINTVKELVDLQVNSSQFRSDFESEPLCTIDVENTPRVLVQLHQQGLTPLSVPQNGQEVVIMGCGSLTTDVTDLIHPSIKVMAQRAAAVIHLDIAGIDVIAEDISRPLNDQSVVIIEINAGPGLLNHVKPLEGKPRAVGQSIVDYLFPVGKESRIPVVGICGSQHSTDMAHLLDSLLKPTGKVVGVASERGLNVGTRILSKRPSAHYVPGQQLLMNNSIETAIIVNDPIAILKDGLPYDRCTVGIVTDMTLHDSLRDFYVDDMDALEKVQRTQVDVVLEMGTSILNADDPHVVALADHCDGQVLFYSTKNYADGHGHLQKLGHPCLYRGQNNKVFLYSNGQTYDVSPGALPADIDVSSPVFLPALAAAYVLGSPLEFADGIQADCQFKIL